MPTRSRANAAVRKRLQSLDLGLKRPLGDDAEALHRTRVATRRLREALPLLQPAEDDVPLAELKHAIRDFTRALGGVRETDVALDLVARLASERPDLQPALDAVRAAIARERLDRLDRARGQMNVRRLRRVSRALSDQLAGSAGRPSAQRLAERLRVRTEKLRRAIDRAGMLYAAERLHRVRLATKKLRYVLELADELDAIPARRLVAELRRVQECLGLLHDFEIVAQHARRALVDPAVPEPIARLADPTLSLLEQKIHTQHAAYLGMRDGLLGAIERAATLQKRVRISS